MSEQQTGPTPSPATNEIYWLCEAIAKGAHDRIAELQQKVATRVGETSQAKGTFLQAINTESPEYMETFADEIGGISHAFDVYSAALDGIARTLKKPEGLADAGRALAEASINLRLANMHYENQVLAFGPSRFKPVNLIENLGKAFLAGRAPAATWQGTCREWADFHRKVIEEIDASKHQDAPGIQERKRASQKAIEAMEKLEKLTSPDELEAGVALWRDAHEGLEASGRAYEEHVFMAGPTPSKQANLVITLALGVLEKNYSVGALINAANGMHDQVRQGLVDFHKLTSQPTEETRLIEEFPKMLAALEGLDDTLQDILDACVDSQAPDPEVLKRALEQFENHAVDLHRVTQTIETYNQSAGKIPCPTCQTYNSPGTRFCTGCQRSLPQVAGGEGFGAQPGTLQVMEDDGVGALVGGPLITEKMKILNDACIALDNGELEEDAFLALLDEMEAECHTTEAGLAEMSAPEIPPEATDDEAERLQEFVDLAEDALALLSLGVSECLAGLEMFRAYVHNRKPEDSLEGARLYFEGIQKLYQVQKVDEAFQRALASGPPPKDVGDGDESPEAESEPEPEGEEAHAEDTNVA